MKFYWLFHHLDSREFVEVNFLVVVAVGRGVVRHRLDPVGSVAEVVSVALTVLLFKIRLELTVVQIRLSWSAGHRTGSGFSAHPLPDRVSKNAELLGQLRHVGRDVVEVSAGRWRSRTSRRTFALRSATRIAVNAIPRTTASFANGKGLLRNNLHASCGCPLCPRDLVHVVVRVVEVAGVSCPGYRRHLHRVDGKREWLLRKLLSSCKLNRYGHWDKSSTEGIWGWLFGIEFFDWFFAGFGWNQNLFLGLFLGDRGCLSRCNCWRNSCWCCGCKNRSIFARVVFFWLLLLQFCTKSIESFTSAAV